MGKLDEKIAFVTGASRGIGAEIARLFAAEGARVACIARTVQEGDHPLPGSLSGTVQEIRDAGGEAEAFACNVARYEDCQSTINEAQEHFGGGIDVLVNNAALTYFVKIADFPISKWLRSTDVNFHAPFYLSQLVLPHMRAQKQGAIVNISSGAAIGPGRGPYPEPPAIGGTLYGAEKAALERFTQGLASEVYEDGISVTCVSPSQVVPTPGVMHHKLLERKDDPRAEPEEMMARAALLLATEPLDEVAGRVTYSQEILHEFGWIDEGRGIGFEREGSGYSKI